MKHQIYARYPLGNPKRAWRQDAFVRSSFAMSTTDMRAAVTNMAEAGFNLLELGWASHDQAETALRMCETLGVDLIYQDFSVFGGMQERQVDRKVSAGEIQREADHLRRYRHCVGTYVWDEPYCLDQLQEARRQADIFRRELPGRVGFTCSIPSYNLLYTWENGLFPQMLEQYVTVLEPEVLSLDYYPIGLSRYFEAEKQLDNSLMWCDLGLMRRMGEKYQLPIWFYYQGVDLYHCGIFHYTMTRMMMYAAVLYGAKGLQLYSAVGSVLNPDGSKGIYFKEQQQLHREFAALGDTLMALTCKKVYHSADLLPDSPYTAGLFEDIAESEWLSGALPKRISASELCDDYGNTYLMVLNRDYETPQGITLALKKPCRVYAVSRKDGHQSVLFERTEQLPLSLAAGDASLLRIQNADDEPFTAEYLLSKEE